MAWRQLERGPKWTWHLLTLFSLVLQEETINSFVEKVASHLQCQEEAVLEWKAYVELRVVKATSSQTGKERARAEGHRGKTKKRLQELEKLAVKVAKENKTKLKKNNRSRKQERLRLRNSEDPADKRKKRRSIAGRQRAEKEGVRNEEERAARTQAASQGHRRRPQHVA